MNSRSNTLIMRLIILRQLLIWTAKADLALNLQPELLTLYVFFLINEMIVNKDPYGSI